MARPRRGVRYGEHSARCGERNGPCPRGTEDSERAAITWSPRPLTDSDLVVGVFEAVRAYILAPEAVSEPPLNTLMDETYATYWVLGLSEDDTKGVKRRHALRPRYP